MDHKDNYNVSKTQNDKLRVRDVAINSKPTTENTSYGYEIFLNILTHSYTDQVAN